MALLRFSATVGGYTAASRVLGFVRDILIAAVMGAGPVADAFVVAFRIPNLFRRLVAEGAFNAAFVPLFSGRLEREGREAAIRFAEESLAVMVAALLLFTAAAMAAMPWLMYAIAPGFARDPEKFDLAVTLTRITFPYLLFMALAALLGGMLNSVYRFAAAAAAPVLLNVVLIAVLLFFAETAGTPGHALAWGVVVAGAGQFLLLAFAARRAGLALRLPRPRLTPAVRRLLRLMLPGVIGGGVTQINVVVGTIIASILPTGAVAYLYYADRLYQLPLGVVGIAIGTALLPDLSRRLRGGDGAGAADSQNRALELSMLVTLPAAAALIAVPGPIVTVLFERGAFDATATARTAAATAAFAAGLPAFVLVKVLSPAFFAREDTTTPVKIAAASVAANIVLSLALVRPFGHVGIAAATSVAAWLNAGLLARLIHRRRYFALDGGVRRRLPRIVLCAIALGLALWLAEWALADAFRGTLAVRVGALAALVAGGIALYGGLALAAGAASPADLRRLARRGG